MNHTIREFPQFWRTQYKTTTRQQQLIYPTEINSKNSYARSKTIKISPTPHLQTNDTNFLLIPKKTSDQSSQITRTRHRIQRRKIHPSKKNLSTRTHYKSLNSKSAPTSNFHTQISHISHTRSTGPRRVNSGSFVRQTASCLCYVIVARTPVRRKTYTWKTKTNIMTQFNGKFAADNSGRNDIDRPNERMAAALIKPSLILIRCRDKGAWMLRVCVRGRFSESC